MEIDEITEDMTGRYLVTTQGSTHLWDLDQKCYIRNPGPESKAVGIPGYMNDTPLYWTDVERWPKVGTVFLTTLSGDVPWHRSSTIKSIEVLES